MAGNKITKADIVDSVYEQTGIIRKEIRTVIDLTIEEIKNSLINGTVIELRGFGTFERRVRKGRQKARNPKTGETVSVTSHGIAAFRPGRELKQSMWTPKPSDETRNAEIPLSPEPAEDGDEDK